MTSLETFSEVPLASDRLISERMTCPGEGSDTCIPKPLHPSLGHSNTTFSNRRRQKIVDNHRGGTDRIEFCLMTSQSSPHVMATIAYSGLL